MNNLLIIGLVVAGILIWQKISSQPKFVIGNIITIGTDVYTVHGVDTNAKQYLLFPGEYPNDTVAYDWVSSDYIDSIAIKINHVTISYPE